MKKCKIAPSSEKIHLGKQLYLAMQSIKWATKPCNAPAGKGLTFWLSFVSVSLSLSHWYPGSGVVIDCIDF